MKKNLFIAFFFTLGSMHLSAQTLFTYGKYSVDSKEFLKAFNKNNTPSLPDKAKAIRSYLDLYIHSRLKIRAAYDRKFDTLPTVRSEVESLHRQIAENYMTDPVVSARLQREAFQRSQSDIQVAHIFISFSKNGIIDSSAAQSKKSEVERLLAKGEDFIEVARKYSDDTSAKSNGGIIGYITVFTLPYEFENAVYTTPVGKYSSTVPSNNGYHIFKNLGERKAFGMMKARQILLAVPPQSDPGAQQKIAALADSLYQAARSGSDFNVLASAFSNDYISAANNGLLPPIGIGQYDPVFESILWSLKKDGDLSKPFLTSHGWHILKRESLNPVPTDSLDAANRQELLSKIMGDRRWKASRDFIYKIVQDKPGLKKTNYKDAALWAVADSLIDQRPMTEAGKSMTLSTPLFRIGDSVYTAENWINYTRLYRFKINGAKKSYDEVRQEFIQASLYNYYQNHLESYNEAFRLQMNEFRDGTIFFEIMQQEVWNKAQSDTSGLKALYEKNKTNYSWKKSADAVIFYCSDDATAKTLYAEIKKDPQSWKKAAEFHSEKVVADSSRFEWDQLPGPPGTTPQAGMATEPVLNTNDNSMSFAVVLKVYTEPLPRNFNEARGLVINDYQEILEKKWTDDLKKKYPVKINQQVLEQISK